MTALLDATVPEIAADFLGAHLIRCCTTRRLAGPEALAVYVRSHSRGMTGPGYWIGTDRGGCRWSNRLGEGLIGWDRLWDYAVGAPEQLDLFGRVS